MGTARRARQAESQADRYVHADRATRMPSVLNWDGPRPHLFATGICFGHQIIARALGGECVPNGRWEIGPTNVKLTNLGQQIFGVETLVSAP